MKRTLSVIALFVLLLSFILVAGADAPVDATLVDGFPQPGGPAPNAAVPASGLDYTILDDFNRDDGPIGADWTIHDGGYFNIVSNAVQGGGYARATFNPYAGDGMAAEADVANNGTSLQFTGLVLNFGYGVNDPFLKVQNQSGGNQFGHAACYLGGGGSFGLGFFALDSPFTTAHMKASRVGDTVTIEFTNVDGGAQGDQTYVCTGAPPIDGPGIGIVGYAGIARLDNFGVPGEPTGTIHVYNIAGYFSSDYLGRPILRAHVWVEDDGANFMSDVLVDASIWVPDGGPHMRSRYTKPSGEARFHYGSWTYGMWTLCVDSLTLAGYTYEPGDNIVTCMDWYN